MILEDAKGGSRSDWLAFRMLIERELGDKAKVGPLRKALLAQQNSDGGWGHVRGDPRSSPARFRHRLATLGLLRTLPAQTEPERSGP